MLRGSAESQTEQVVRDGRLQNNQGEDIEGNVQDSRDNEHGNVTFEDVLQKLGTFGKFQFLQCAMCLTPMIIFSFNLLGFVFIGYTPPHICNKVNETELLASYDILNDSTVQVSYEQCHITVTSNQSGLPEQFASMGCPNGRDFPEGKYMGLVSEWDLVCESASMAEFAFMLGNVGDIVGSFIVPSIADRFGRKLIMSLSLVLQLLMGMVIAFSPDIVFYCVALFLNGLIISGLVSTYLCLGMELLTTRHREVLGIAGCYCWVFCAVIVGCVAYLLKDVSWRYFQITGALTGLFSLPMVFFLHESVRWLAVNGKTKEACKVIKKASQQNNVDFAQAQTTFEQYIAYNLEKETKKCTNTMPKNEAFCNTLRKCLCFKINNDKSVENYTLMNLLTRKDTLVILLILWYIWAVCNFNTFGIFLSSSDLAGNRFLNFCLIALMEIPCDIVLMFAMKRMGRLSILRIAVLLAALCFLASFLLSQFEDNSDESKTVTLVLYLVSAYAMACYFNIIYIVTPEMFPTVLRSAGNGSCRAVAKVGYMVAPFMRPLYAAAKWAPSLIFASLCLTTLPLTFLLPEMKDRILPTKPSDVHGPKRLAQKQCVDNDCEHAC